MKTLSLFILYFIPSFLFAQASDLFISEYIEGSSYNKAIELYNGTGETVDLSDYSIEKDQDGDNEFDKALNLNGFLKNDSVYVITNSRADSINSLITADTIHYTITNFNGDDQIRLMRDSVEVDRIGISGDINFGVDVTYIRKSEIKAPTPGEQDPRSNGEWDEHPKDYFDDLGKHTYTGGFGDLKPEIISFSYGPKFPKANEDILVYVTAIDDSALSAVNLLYKINGQVNELQMQLTAVNNLYYAKISSSEFNDGDRLEYYVLVEDDAGQQTITEQINVFIGTSSISDIKEADENGILLYKDYNVRVQGVVTANQNIFNNTTFVQDENAGIKWIINIPLTEDLSGSLFDVTGIINQNNGMAEIITDDTTSVFNWGAHSVPNPFEISILEFYDSPEIYEGAIVNITNAKIMDGSSWPEEGFDADIFISDGDQENTLTMYIDKNTDIDGADFADSTFNLTGIIIQDDESLPYDSGYKIMPRSLDDISIVTSISQISRKLPVKLKLYSAYPNPFNPQTTIHFDVPIGKSNNNVELSIYNTLGQKVALLIDKKLQPGSYQINWNAYNQPSGIYFALLKNGNIQQSSRLILIK